MTTDLTTARTALYRCFDDNEELLYVGITYDVKQRWEQHRAAPWWRHVALRTVEWFDDRAAAERAERKAIQMEGPQHNVVHNQRTSLPTADAKPVKPTGQRTLSDIYSERPPTDAQLRRIVAILGLAGGVRRAPEQKGA